MYLLHNFFKLLKIYCSPGNSTESLHNSVTTSDVPPRLLLKQISNKQLCKAVLENDLQMLQYLLTKTDADVNHIDDVERKPPVLLPTTTEVIHILIKHGAEINIPYADGTSLLTHQVKSFNNVEDLERICMLLYYGSDISYGCNDSPILQAVDYNNQILYPYFINYYDDFTNEFLDGYSIVSSACAGKDPFAIDLIKAGASVNCVDDCGSHPLILAFFNDNEELFNSIWDRLDKEIHPPGLILNFILTNCVYAAPLWLKCLFLILDIPGLIFTQDVAFSVDVINECYFWPQLLEAFNEKKIVLKDRIGVIYVCLQRKIKVDTRIITIVHNLFGFDEELEALLYAGNLTNWHDLRLLPAYILAREDSLNFKQLFENSFIPDQFCDQNISIKEILTSLDYFSVPYCLKKHLRSLNNKHLANNNEILKKLNDAPEMPSLVELCRNGVRKFIKHNNVIKHPYQFHDIVKCLKLPESLINVVRFKNPIY